MNNNSRYYDFNNQNYEPPRKKRSIMTYIAVILITSLISSTVVGILLYSKFSVALEKSLALAEMNAPAHNPQAKNETVSSNSSDTSEAISLKNAKTSTANGLQEGEDRGSGVKNGKATEIALPKGSDVTLIAKEAGPAIVGVRMTIAGTRNNYLGGTNSRVGEGSGIIIRKDGYIMTNYHVVYGADPKSTNSARTILEVFLPDGREAKAEFKGGDEKTDLAVIKIDEKDLPIAELGDSSKLEVGELAVAIGNPLGMEFAGSVTVGVISALNRTMELENRTMNLIQTDAAINEGNSGGALLNSSGQVIGINSVKIAASGVEGLGFAIPVNDAWPIVDQLIRYGYVKGRPFIGISGREISSIYASYYGIAEGIYITDVTQGSGADRAGIMPGDIIVSMAGNRIEAIKDLDKVKETYKPGDTVTVVVNRDNKNISLRLTFGEEV